MSKLTFVLLDVEVENVDTSKMRYDLVGKTFDNITTLSKYLINRKLNSAQFEIKTLDDTVDYFNNNSSIDGQWLTYIYIQ